MRRILSFVIAAMLAAGGFAAPAKIATQEWVKKALAGIGVRVSTSTVETNITASATGGAQTNIVFTSPYTCEEVPQCRSISFTVSPAKTAYRQAMTPQKRSLLDLLLLKAYADGQIDTTVYMTIESGYWTDAAGNVHMFLFDGGWTVELQDDVLPDPPTEPHVCKEFDTDCVCRNYGVSASHFAKDPEYQQYADVGVTEFYSAYGNFEQWINLETWGAATWQKTKSGPKGTEYFIQDVDGYWFNVKNIFEKSDAIIDAMVTTVKEINDYMKECRDEYVELNTCDKKDPQHQWDTSSCGSYTWKKCKNNSKHTEGSARHSYPGKSVSSLVHACMCGEGPEEPHGVLIPDVRTETDKGWIESRICPKGCGYSEDFIHQHHFTDCGNCDAGDECNAPCKGCGGAHKFIAAAKDACAPCECEWSQDCKGTPPATDFALHAAWLPCGEDTEDDNDWLEAKGGHCQCACKAYGHIARTEHDYKLGGGFAPFEAIQGDEQYHYRRLGECTRCGQHKKQKESHEYPEEPTSYNAKGSEICERVYVCVAEGCGHVKRTEGSHKYGVTVEWINVSDKICRAVSYCQNCGGLCYDDSQRHSTTDKYLGAIDGYTVWEIYCTRGCGWKKTDNRECSHSSYGAWYKVGEVPGGVIMQANCNSCAHRKTQTVKLEGMTECNEEVGIHLPLESDCGCECGHYGSESAANDTEFHKWENETKCRCKCGTKHQFRKNGECPKVCADCKEINQYGFAAKESDHTKASGHVCGCACGYYGVSADHSASGHYAETSYLHKQASTHGNGIPSFCQCYGAEGTGGEWHWRTARSQTCPRICTYKRGDIDPLGHLAARSSPEKGITPAKPEDHAAKTYGCGCKCGLCDDENRGKWIHQKTLHHAAQNAEDQCHCACESRELVGKTEGHTFKTCICTCKEKHDSKNYPLNACGYCSSCGYIWRNGVRLDAGNRNNHLWANGGCYCDGGCVVGGVKMLHADGHRYMKNKCICLCGEATREHILVEQKERVGQWTCWKCNAVFLNFRVTTVCSRCEATVSTEHIGSVGEHFSGCGEPKPHCWKCGCHCTTWGAHTTCNVHYCNACCTKKPPKPPRPPKPNPDDPDPDEPEPEPPEPYVTCKHPRTETHDWDYHWTCEECSNDFHSWGWRKHCVDCGAYIDSESHSEGKHGPPCNGEDPGHVCEPSICGEELNGGGTCQESYCHSCESCPNASQHKNHHGGNGGSGGGGGLEDI